MLQGNMNYQALWGEANPQLRVPGILRRKAEGHKNLGSRIQQSQANVKGLTCIPGVKRCTEAGCASDKAPTTPRTYKDVYNLETMDQWTEILPYNGLVPLKKQASFSF